MAQLNREIGPLHALSAVYPRLGDTTSTSALIFSPLLYSLPQPEPSYPNYTLPDAQLAFPDFSYAEPLNSSLSSNLTLIVIPTNSSPTSTGLDNSVCAINAASAKNSVSGVNNIILKSFQPEWMTVGDEQGFRSYWVLGDLTEQGNYTAWVSDDKGVLSQPAWFTTKSGTSSHPFFLRKGGSSTNWKLTAGHCSRLSVSVGHAE